MRLDQAVLDKYNMIISVKVQWMVPGDPGKHCPSVPRAAQEEQRPGRDCVTVQPRHTVVNTVRVMTLKRDSVTINHVS